MGLLRTALVFGAGYAFGHPDGRRKLTELGGQARQLTQRPEVVQLRERSWDTVSTKLKSTRPAGSEGDVVGDAAPAGRRSWRPRPYPRRATQPATTPAAGVGSVTPVTPDEAVTTVTPVTPATTTVTPAESVGTRNPGSPSTSG